MSGSPLQPQKPKTVKERFLKKKTFFSLIEAVRVPGLMLLYSIDRKAIFRRDLIEREKREKWFPVSETND